MKAVTGILKRPESGGPSDVSVLKQRASPSTGGKETGKGVNVDRAVALAVQEGARNQAARISLLVTREAERREIALRRWQESISKAVSDVASRDLEIAVTRSISELVNNMQSDIRAMIEDAIGANLEKQVQEAACRVAHLKIEETRKQAILANGVEAVLSSEALNTVFGKIFVDNMVQPMQKATQGVLERVASETSSILDQQLVKVVTNAQSSITQATDSILRNLEQAESQNVDNDPAPPVDPNAAKIASIEGLVQSAQWLEAIELANGLPPQFAWVVSAMLRAEVERESFMGDLDTDLLLVLTEDLATNLADQTETRLFWIDDAVEALCSREHDSQEREEVVLEFVIESLKSCPEGDIHRKRRTMRLVNSELILVRRSNRQV